MAQQNNNENDYEQTEKVSEGKKVATFYKSRNGYYWIITEDGKYRINKNK